jgi:hypothetical protein
MKKLNHSVRAERRAALGLEEAHFVTICRPESPRGTGQRTRWTRG